MDLEKEIEETVYLVDKLRDYLLLLGTNNMRTLACALGMLYCDLCYYMGQDPESLIKYLKVDADSVFEDRWKNKDKTEKGN